MVSEAPDRLRVSVSCIDDDGRFLREATGRGADLSPEILLAGMDERARSLAVVLEDITHPLFGTMTHWLIWNLDPAVRIPGEIPAGRRVGRTAARLLDRESGMVSVVIAALSRPGVVRIRTGSRCMYWIRC